MTDFDRWESRFAIAEYVFGTEPNAFVAAQGARLPAHGRALAVADGEGRNGVWLAEQGLDVLSLDFSPSAQAKALALAASRGVGERFRVELADVLRWAWPSEAFDVIAIVFAQFTSPDERTRLFAGVRRALKPGGLLLLEGYSPKQLAYRTGGPAELERLYTRELLEREFAGFAALEIREYDADLNEGTRHAGRSALIDLVATK